MNKKLLSLTLLLVAQHHGNLFSMSGGAMDAGWFYAEENPFNAANKLHQERNWAPAATKYQEILDQKLGSENDTANARLNLAACMMAQRKPSTGWKSFDELIHIEKNKQLPELKEESTSIVSNLLQCFGLAGQNKKQLSEKSVLVRSEKVGIGDIAHFWEVLSELKKRTGANVILSVRPMLIEALQERANADGIILMSEKAPQPDCDHITHMISLYGHLNMAPQSLSPKKPVFTTTDNAIVKVSNQINPLLAQGSVVVVFEGEDRQATLIGGKQLPRDITKHGRHLGSEAFMTLLKKHPELRLIDCKTKDRQLTIENGLEGRVQPLAAEEKPFDTTIALAILINRMKIQDQKKVVVLAADQGPSNVFARSLTPNAQNQMAFIIPNGGEYDMRMEGTGKQYQQMISECRVYKCATPEEQSEVVEQAYCDMTKN